MLGTYNDPCPLVAIESMACGTPVIAFRKGGIPEIVQDGITGILLDSVDDGLKRMKYLPSINNKKCRDIAEREFSRARMADRYFALYLRLVRKIKKGGYLTTFVRCPVLFSSVLCEPSPSVFNQLFDVVRIGRWSRHDPPPIGGLIEDESREAEENLFHR